MIDRKPSAGKKSDRSRGQRTTAMPHLAGAGELRQIAVSQVDAPEHPPRRFMGDLAALAESMQDYGLQQPISVRAVGDRFVLTSGLRRLTAARMLLWETIPAFVRDVDADDAYLLDMIENLQREDLTAEEEARAFRELIQARGWSIRQLAQGIKRSAAYVSKRLRVFDDPVLREAIVVRGLPVSTAEELLAAPAELRDRVLELAIAQRWDQTRAREELQARMQRRAETAEPDEGIAKHASAGSARPPGLTRSVREFHQLIIGLEPSQLTEADRAAFRSLYRDLTMLARAPSAPTPRILPPLPTVPGSGSSARRARRARHSA